LNIITGSNGGRPPSDPVRVAERHIQFCAEKLEIHCRPKCLQPIAEIAQPLQPIVDVEKPQLAPHAVSSESITPMESEDTRIRQVFRSVQLSLAGAETGRGTVPKRVDHTRAY
jgi:hypothetical protein